METKFIWTVSFGDNDFDDLNCAFDNFKSAKKINKLFFPKVLTNAISCAIIKTQ